jgi:predicted ABC-type ATPase
MASESFPDAKLRKTLKENLGTGKSYTTYKKTLEQWIGPKVESMKRPHMIVMFGPTGSGKSTFLPLVLKRMRHSVDTVVHANVDALVEASPEWNGTESKTGRDDYLRIRRAYGDAVNDSLIQYCLDHSLPFVFETTGATMSSIQWLMKLIRDALRAGFEIHTVWPFATVTELKERVKERGQRTGRVVSSVDVETMAQHAVQHFFHLLPLSDRAYLYNNSATTGTVGKELMVYISNSSSFEPTIFQCNLRVLPKTLVYTEGKQTWDKSCEWFTDETE